MVYFAKLKSFLTSVLFLASFLFTQSASLDGLTVGSWPFVDEPCCQLLSVCPNPFSWDSSLFFYISELPSVSNLIIL